MAKKTDDEDPALKLFAAAEKETGLDLPLRSGCGGCQR